MEPPATAPLFSIVPDKILIVVLPVVVYWTASLVFYACDKYGFWSKYKLHTPEEFLTRNRVPIKDVVREVLIQHALQILMGSALAYFEADPVIDDYDDIAKWRRRLSSLPAYFPSILSILGLDTVRLAEKINSLPTWTGVLVGGNYSRVQAFGSDQAISTTAYWEVILAKTIVFVALPTLQYLIAAFCVDTWQYSIHFMMHKNKWLYRTFHYRHHRLYVPYAFGALYNHPLEGFIEDTLGSILAFKIARLSLRQGIIFFTFATLKTVDDHSGFRLPWDPLQLMTDNNSFYHDIHHQSWGMKSNFSQPFTSFWDRVFGTMWKEGEKAKKHGLLQQVETESVIKDRNFI